MTQGLWRPGIGSEGSASPMYSTRSAIRYDISATATTVEQISQSVHQYLGRLLQKRVLDEAVRDEFAAARTMLEAMPLPTDQFGLACTRLKNAQHYLQYTEPGAAWYGWRLCTSSLRSDQRQVREPQRRCPLGLTVSTIELLEHLPGGMVCGAPSAAGRIWGMIEPYDSSPTSERSVTLWLEQLQKGDSAAAKQLWQRYVERLIRLRTANSATCRVAWPMRRMSHCRPSTTSCVASTRDASCGSTIEKICGKYSSCSPMQSNWPAPQDAG